MYCRTGFLWLRLPQKCSQEDQASSLKLSSPTCTKMSANGSKTTSLFLPRWFILPKGTWIKSWSNNPYFDLSYCLFLWNVQQTPGRYPRYPKIQIWTDFLHKKVVEVLGYVPLYVGDVLDCLFQSVFVVATSLVQAQHPRQPAPWTTSTPPEERWKPRGLPSWGWFTLPETNSKSTKNGGVQLEPHFPNVYFQGLLLLVSGRVSMEVFLVHLSACLHHFCHYLQMKFWGDERNWDGEEMCPKDYW